MSGPPAGDGVAFSEEGDGDLRLSTVNRSRLSSRLGIDENWAWVSQVHGADVVHVEGPGDAGEADAIWTTERGLPLAIFTADCFGVVLHASGAVGVAHAGWRGASEGVVANLRSELTNAGYPPERVAIGPGIGPCCFEVGSEVATRFPGHVSTTTWGTTSVDLPSVIVAQLDGLDVRVSGSCTRHEPGWFSHRATGTDRRLASLGWIP